MEIIKDQIELIIVSVIAIITGITTIWQTIKASLNKIKAKNSGYVLDIKDAVTKFVIEAEKIFTHGDNFTKLTWVIDNVRRVLPVYECTSTLITEEINKVLDTIKNFNNSNILEKE